MTAVSDVERAVAEAVARLAERGLSTATQPSADPVVVRQRADRAADRIEAVAGLIAAGEINARDGTTIADSTAYWVRHLGITYADITAAREARARSRAAIRALHPDREAT